MRKIVAWGTVFLMILMPFINVGGDITKFKDGGNETIVSLNSSTLIGITNITVPWNCSVINATMTVSAMSAENNISTYPESIVVKIENDTIWNFKQIGFGSMGSQDRFSSDAKSVTSQFGVNGGTNKALIRLPKSAYIQNTTLKMTSCPPIKSNELMRIIGFYHDSAFGGSLADAGDLNGDGYNDIIIGAPCIDPSSIAGHAYIFLGGKNMDNVTDIILDGTQINDHFGRVSDAGDVNNDGYDDVIVGAWGFDFNGTDTGRVYLYHGGVNMDNTSDVIFTGACADCRFGCDVSSAGDVNNDGYDDIVIGAIFDSSSGIDSGRAYIYFGGKNMDNVADVILNGSSSGDRFGCSISNAGDVNNDGYDDVLVGAYDNDQNGKNCGQAYVYYGGKNMDGNADVIIDGKAAGDWFGYKVSTARDINKDGNDDVLVSAIGSNSSYIGWTYLFYGSQNMDNISDVTFTGDTAGKDFGNSISDVGDANKDGWNDIIIGTFSENRAYVFLGSQEIDSISDVKYNGYDHFGDAVSDAGDINKDGFDDLLIGNPYNKTAGESLGAAFIYSLNNSDNPGVLDVGVKIGPHRIWGTPGYSNGTYQIKDFSEELNDYLRMTPICGTDGYGNDYVDVPINIETNNSGNITLFNLSVTYNYNASVPNFAAALNKYIGSHQNEKDANGNITVPINISAKSAGRLRLSNLKIEYFINQAPSMVKEIGTTELDEDSANVTLIDLYQYFKDDLDPVNNLTFSVASWTNQSHVKLWMTANRYLSADAMTGDVNDNWTGTVQAKVACADRSGLKTESNLFTIIIRNVNDRPIITSVAPLDVGNGIPYFYNVTAIDGDNDSIGYSLLKAPPNMTIDNKTGEIQWMRPTKGSFTVSVQASDGNWGTDSQLFYLAVPNGGPRITSSPSLNASTGTKYYYNVTAEDIDNDKLNFSLETDAIGMKINSATGVLTWTPEFPGDFEATVFVSDGELKDRLDFTITVLKGNNIPRFVSKAVVAAFVGIPYSYTAKAVDSDSDTIVYSLLDAPEGMTIGSGNGIVSWVPMAVGNFTFTILASDGKGGDANQEVTISVVPVVRPSVEILRPIEGAKVSGKVDVSGLVMKGTRNVVKVQVSVDGGEWTDATGNSSWTFRWDTTKLKHGAHVLSARAFDGTDYSDPVTRTFSVDNKNQGTAKGFIPGFEGLLVVAVIGLICVIGQHRRKK